MGLFGKRFELKSEYFTDCFCSDKNEIHRIRSLQGFKVTKYVDIRALNICAEKKQLFSTFTIINKLFANGDTRCEFHVYELFRQDEFFIFLDLHFKPTPKNIRFLHPGGIQRDYYEKSYYLPDGNILRYLGQQGTHNNWFSFDTISKNHIID